MKELLDNGFYVPDELETLHPNLVTYAGDLKRLGIYFRQWGKAYGLGSYDYKPRNEERYAIVELDNGRIINDKVDIDFITEQTGGLMQQENITYEHALDQACHMYRKNIFHHTLDWKVGKSGSKKWTTVKIPKFGGGYFEYGD